MEIIGELRRKMTSQKIISDIHAVLAELIIYFDKKKDLSLFQRREVKKISSLVYHLYSTDFRYYHAFANIVEGIIHEDKKEDITTEIQFYRKQLETAIGISESYKKPGIIPAPGLEEGWIYIYSDKRRSVRENFPIFRLYLNCKLDKLVEVVGFLVAKMSYELQKECFCSHCGEEGIPGSFLCSKGHLLPRNTPLNFKFHSPFALSDTSYVHFLRPEKITLYAVNSPTVLKELIGLMKSHPAWFESQIPFFTTKVCKGVGFAPNINTAQEEKFFQETSQHSRSFGDFISIILAKTLTEFYLQYHRLPRGDEIMAVSEHTFEEELKNKYKLEFSLAMKE